jgi:predicted ATPase
MLTSLRIRHFRAWQDTGPVRLAPLTVFFGEHGTGKSSLGHALALLDPHAHEAVSDQQAGFALDAAWQAGGRHVIRHLAAASVAERAPAPLTFVDTEVQGAPLPPPSADNPAILHWLHAMGLDASPTTSQASRSARHARHLLAHLFDTPNGGTVWFEHPENHLHPKAQAVLADALIAAVQATAEGIHPGVQCIVESHSEAFLNRLQRRVAEAVIPPGNIALYVCRLRGPHAELEALQLNAYGDIENWPEDLFGHDMTDITARTLAALRRRQADAREPKA